MMQLSARNVRAYKGAAASILLLFLVERRAMEQGELRRGTGYGNDVIHDALLMLREDGLVVELGRYTWGLLEGARQLPIGAVEAEIDQRSAVSDQPEEVGPTESELDVNESMNESRNDSDGDDSLIDKLGPKKTELTAAWLHGLGFYGKGLADLAQIPGLTQAEVEWQVEHSPSLGCALSRLRKRQGWGNGQQRERDGPKGSDYVSGEFAEFIKH